MLIQYEGQEEDTIHSYLFIPEGTAAYPALIVHHLHNREHHLGKSVVAVIAGDPLQTFGLAPAGRGFVVLAPDSVYLRFDRHNRKRLFG